MTDAFMQSGFKVRGYPARLRDHGFWSQTAASPPLMITAPAQDVMRKPVPPAPHQCSSLDSRRGQEKSLGQFYTRPDLAERYYQTFRRFFDPAEFQMVEPGAGCGAFLALLPMSSFGCDIEPRCSGVFRADFLAIEIESARPVACIGNPPFGRNARLAARFFNQAASFSDVIAFIVPKTFRKTGTINSLDDKFHMLHEEPVPSNAFLFQGKQRSVPTVFQIWIRRDGRRVQLVDMKTHPDFRFTSREHARFAIQRVGRDAGRVHHDLWRSSQAHYFIQGDVEDVMKELEPAFALAAQNTAGQPSLAMSEIVSLYSERISTACGR